MTKTLVIEIDYEQGGAEWDKRPTTVLVDGKESSLNDCRQRILEFQPQVQV